MKKNRELKKVLSVYLTVLCVWTFYRAVFWFPVWLEELVIKPVVFLGPVFWVVKKEKSRLDFLGLSKDIFKAIRLGVLLGLIYGLAAFWFNYLKYGTVQLVSFGLAGTSLLVFLGLALATAISEEVLFRGYLLKKLIAVWKDEWSAVLFSGLLFALIHLPLLVFTSEQGGLVILVQFLLTLLVGWGNGVVMLRTGNILAPILSHVFWGTTIFLFR